MSFFGMAPFGYMITYFIIVSMLIQLCFKSVMKWKYAVSLTLPLLFLFSPGSVAGSMCSLWRDHSSQDVLSELLVRRLNSWKPSTPLPASDSKNTVQQFLPNLTKKTNNNNNEQTERGKNITSLVMFKRKLHFTCTAI